MMKRVQILGAILVTWLAAVASVPGGWIEDGDGKTIIHVSLFDLPDPTRVETSIRADAAVVKEFVRQYPAIFAETYREKYRQNPQRYGMHNWANVEIQLHRFSGITIQNLALDARPLMAIAGGVSPDVIYVNFRQSDTYIQQGFLYPLDKPEDGYFSRMPKEEIDLRIHEKIRPVIQRKGADGSEHVWALPYGGALGKVVLYRKDLFDAAGVAYPSNDWTWDDFLAACRKITDPERGIYGIGLGRGLQESWYWMSFLWSAGGEAITYDESSGQWRAIFDSREAAEALDFYTQLCTEPWKDAQGRQRHGYAFKDTSADVKWTRGEIAMFFSYVDEKLFSTINPDVTGMVPVPIGPTGRRGAELNSRMMGLFAGIEQPAVRDAAWEYMRFFDGPEAVRIKTRILVEGGLGRFVNPRYLAMFGYPELIRLAPRGWKECFDIAIQTGRPEPYGRNCQLVYNMMTKPLQAAEQMALSGKLPTWKEDRLDVFQKLLKDAAAITNEKMLGILTPRERMLQRATAGIAIAGIILVFTLGLWKIARSFLSAPHAAVAAPSLPFKKYSAALMLLLPAVLSIAVWQYWPVIQGSLIAFMDYRIMGGSHLVWLDNFGAVLWDPEWWQAVWNSLRYSFLVICLTFIPPLVLAILLQEVPRGSVLFRVIFYLPAVMTGLIVILLWKAFYDPTENGVLNHIMLKIPAIVFIGIGVVLLLIFAAFCRRLLYHQMNLAALMALAIGVVLLLTCVNIVKPILLQTALPLGRRLLSTLPEGYRWLQDPDTAMLACVMPLVWAGIGPGCLIYLAALKSIPEELYEVADLDGATFIDKIIFVIFPLLKVLLIINFVGVFIHAWLYASGNILAMTGGASNTEVADLHIFYAAFMYLQFGPAAAMAWILGLMLIGFTIYQLRILSRIEFRAAGSPKRESL